MYDYFYYGASMFPSNGNHFVRAVKKGSMTAVAAVEQLIAGDHVKALGKLMAEHDKFTADTRKVAFDKVIEARNLECFEVMYANDGYSRNLNSARYRLLLQLHGSGWTEALDKVFSTWSHNNANELFKFVTLDMPDDIRRRVIAQDYRLSAESMLDCAASQAPQWVPYFLEMMEHAPNANKLAQLAVNAMYSNGNEDAILRAFDLLLSRGLNVNFDNGAVMVAVLSKGHIDKAQQLLDSGFEAALSSNLVYEKLCSIGAPRASIDFIKQFTGAAPADAAKSQDGFVRSDDYSVSCVQSLPHGGQLTMLFNFATAQQIVIAQMGEQLAAPTVVPFSRIENRHLLEKAAAAFVADGGDAELASASGAVLRKSPVAKASQPGS